MGKTYTNFYLQTYRCRCVGNLSQSVSLTVAGSFLVRGVYRHVFDRCARKVWQDL